MKQLRVKVTGKPTLVIPAEGDPSVVLSLTPLAGSLEPFELCLEITSFNSEDSEKYVDWWPRIEVQEGRQVTIDWVDDNGELSVPARRERIPSEPHCIVCNRLESQVEHLIEAKGYIALCDVCIKDFARMLSPDEA